MTEIFVGAEDLNLFDALVAIGDGGGRTESVVGLELVHRPHRDTHRSQRFFEDRDLREDLRFHSLGRLVTGPQIVAKTLDHVISRHTDVRGTVREQLKRGIENADGCGVGGGLRRTHGLAVVLPVELVGSVDQVNDHRPIVALDEG
ncbi:MAG: hypothetical protein RLZZ269_1508 [Actinomycetota bacterium]